MSMGALTIFFFIYTVEQFWRLFYPAELEPAVPPEPVHGHQGHAAVAETVASGGHTQHDHACGSHGHQGDSPAGHGHDHHTDHGHGGHGSGHREPDEIPKPLSPMMASLQRAEGAILLKFVLALGLGVWFGAQALSAISESGSDQASWLVLLAAMVLLVSGCVNMFRDAHRAGLKLSESAER